MPRNTWFKISAKAEDDDTAEVSIYDSIGGWGVTAKEFCEKFNGLKSKKINVRINSPGGEVFDSIAIHNAIKAHAAETCCIVDGLAASGASIIAIAGKKVEMLPNSFMMIHNAMNMCFGYASDMRKEAETLDKLSSSLADMYAQKTGKPVQDIQKMMDDETWFDAAEAKALGMVDSIGDDEDEDDEDTEQNKLAVAQRAVAKYKRAPEQLRRYAASTPRRTPPKEIPVMAAKPIARDGKTYVLIGGVEHEIEAPVAQVDVGAIETARKEAAEKAVADERAYRGMFATVVASAKLDAASAEKFEKDFYGRAEADLKFLAQHAIGTRAQPVGEGSGNPEQQPAAGSAEAKDVREYCAKRFASDPAMRRRFRVNTTNINDETYKAGLERYIVVETKCRADEAKPQNAKSRELDEDGNGDDPITRIMKNRSVYTNA